MVQLQALRQRGRTIRKLQRRTGSIELQAHHTTGGSRALGRGRASGLQSRGVEGQQGGKISEAPILLALGRQPLLNQRLTTGL